MSNTPKITFQGTEKQYQTLLQQLRGGHIDTSILYAFERIDPPRWRAEAGQIYWFVNSACDASQSCEYNREHDEKRFVIGNYYRTEAEAQAAAERVLRAYKEG